MEEITTFLPDLLEMDIQDNFYLLVLLLQTTVIILILWVLQKVIKKYLNKKFEDVTIRFKWQKAVTYGAYILGIIIIFPLWFRGLQNVMTFLGLFSAGLAIALRDLISNMVGWLYILFRRPFVMGDRVEIGSVQGDVIDIRLLETEIMEIGNWVESDQSTGRVIYLPNGRVLYENVANYTQGFEFIWNEVSILLTFESDWKLGKKLLEKVARKNAREINREMRDKIINSAKKKYTKLTPIVYTSIKPSGVQLTVRYLCEPRKRRSTAEFFWEDILDMVARHEELELAYPTYRAYLAGMEGRATTARSGEEDRDIEEKIDRNY